MSAGKSERVVSRSAENPITRSRLIFRVFKEAKCGAIKNGQLSAN